jgi:alpha-amylase
MGSLDHTGLAGANPMNAVTFVENHDTDSHGFEAVIQNKMLGYAYILTSEGYPCVFYKDYSMDAGCYKLKPFIDPLLFIHEKLASGSTLQRFKDFDVFAFERMGGPHLLVGLNNDPFATQTINVFTGFGANARLHDYANHGADVQTDGNGKVTITIPKNSNGLGYVCYSRPGFGGPFDVHTHAVTQSFDGAQDLDIKPAAPDRPTQVARIFSAAGKQIQGRLSFDTTNWTAGTSLTLALLDPSGKTMASKVYTRAQQGETLGQTAPAVGFHSFEIQAANTPAASPKQSFTLDVTYTAPQRF